MMYINVLDLVRKYTTCNSQKKINQQHNFAIMNNDLIISEYYDI